MVLDLMMPRLNRLSFVELIRLSPRLSEIPVILVTLGCHSKLPEQEAPDVGGFLQLFAAGFALAVAGGGFDT